MNPRRAIAAGIILALLVGMAVGVVLQLRYGVAKVLSSIDLGRRAAVAPLASGSAADAIPADLQGELSLFILAGQSNMSGRGDMSAGGQPADNYIYVFGNDFRWRVAAEPLDDPAGQVDSVSEDANAGVGPGMSFAATLLGQRPGMAIGLIPCAVGGTTIDDWRRELSENTLYGSCLKRARAASTMGELAGILFFQGESDAIDPSHLPNSIPLPEEWGDRFRQLVSAWRTDFGTPDLPVVFAQIGRTTAPNLYVNWAIVQEQQQAVELPMVAMIVTDDLPAVEIVHFTTLGYATIGERFAAAYVQLTEP